MENSVPDSSEKTNDNIEDVRDLLFGNQTAGNREPAPPTPRAEPVVNRVARAKDSKINIFAELLEEQYESIEETADSSNRIKDVANDESTTEKLPTTDDMATLKEKLFGHIDEQLKMGN